jgi:hypothetical protein
MKDAFNENRVKQAVVDGDIFWRNAAGQCHRIGEPAVVYTDGTKEFWERGQRHCATGAAVRHADGDNEFWLHGARVSQPEFNARQGVQQPLAIGHPLKFKPKGQ